MNILDKLLSFIAPHDCAGCSREGALLCGDCQAALPNIAPIQLPSGGRLLARTTYNGLAKTLVLKLKSGSARAAATEIANLLPVYKTGLVVPVPTASSRVRQRGYDQAVLIARAYARRTGLPYSNHLVRLTQTRQVGASRQQRADQLQHAFRIVRASSLKGQHIILVDDVSTTGATLVAAAESLLHSGAQKVDTVVFARVPEH